MELLTPDLLAALGRLRLVTRRRVVGSYPGAHLSRRLGTGMEFADRREYLPGDDPRRIDVPASQRLGRLLIKLAEVEDEAAVRVVVDLSASMAFGAKADTARRLAAALAALAGSGGDRIRLVVVSDRVVVGPWLRGRVALPAAERLLLAARPPEDGPADLLGAVRRAVAEGPTGPVVLISDLLVADWEPIIEALAAHRGDGLLLHLLGNIDLDPDLDGDLRVVDVETGDEVEVTLDAAGRRAYREALDGWLEAVAATCGRVGVDYVRVTDDTPVAQVLLGELQRLGVVG